jgi:hypothetical protein
MSRDEGSAEEILSFFEMGSTRLKRTAGDLVSCLVTELWQDEKTFCNFNHMKPHRLLLPVAFDEGNRSLALKHPKSIPN